MRFFVFLSIFAFSCASRPPISGTFFSDKQDAIIIESNKGLFEKYGAAPVERLSVNQTRRRLKFKWVAKGRIPILQRHPHRYNFDLLKSNDDSFIIRPKSKKAISYFERRDSIVFKPNYLLIDRSVRLNKIVFHSSRCYGLCPDYSLEIDSIGNLKTTNRGSAEQPISPAKNYIGKLSADEFARLQRLIASAQIRTLRWAPRMCCDGPIKTLIIYSNVPKIHVTAMWTPVVSWDLVNFLNSQFKHRSLVETENQFTYEK